MQLNFPFYIIGLKMFIRKKVGGHEKGMQLNFPFYISVLCAVALPVPGVLCVPPLKMTQANDDHHHLPKMTQANKLIARICMLFFSDKN